MESCSQKDTLGIQPSKKLNLKDSVAEDNLRHTAEGRRDKGTREMCEARERGHLVTAVLYRTVLYRRHAHTSTHAHMHTQTVSTMIFQWNLVVNGSRHWALTMDH